MRLGLGIVFGERDLIRGNHVGRRPEWVPRIEREVGEVPEKLEDQGGADPDAPRATGDARSDAEAADGEAQASGSISIGGGK